MLNNFETSYITKIDEHIHCGYSMPLIWTYDGIMRYTEENNAWESFVNP